MAWFLRNKGRMLSANVTTYIQDRQATEEQGQRGQRGVMGSLQLNPEATGSVLPGAWFVSPVGMFLPSVAHLHFFLEI